MCISWLLLIVLLSMHGSTMKRIRTSLKLQPPSKYSTCDRMQRSLQCSQCWKHCLKSSTEMLSRAASDRRRLSATLAKRLHFKTCFIRGYKKKSRKERGQVIREGGTQQPFCFQPKTAGHFFKISLFGFFLKSPNTLADTQRNARKTDMKHAVQCHLADWFRISYSHCTQQQNPELSRLCGRFKFRKYLSPPLVYIGH